MASSSSAADTTRYDVFLSFRGEDTRDNITDHLYAALVRAALATFRDNDAIDRGQELKPEIDRAIRSSEAAIIVFSKNFATSTWCLDEASLIMEQRSEGNLFVLPIFYKVEPSDVRKQTNSFFIEEETSANTRWTADNVRRWKTTLTNAANLTGLVLAGSETKFVKDIVDIIYNKLTSKKFHLPLNLVRMDTRYEEINSWIMQSDGNFFVICGMGGSGKTTLARYTVYSNRDKFEHISIVENIDSKLKERHHVLELQETLLGGILGVKKQKVLDYSQGIAMIEKALQKNKSLIVLDDIVNQDQLVDLLGTGRINKESKIIVTTRKSDISKWVELKYGMCKDYQMKLLDEREALELFSLHAFGSKYPIEDFIELSQKVVSYCEGNPLALEVLGSSLSYDISIPNWKSEIHKLEKNMHSGIKEKLMRSYTSLSYDVEKKLFLHIACFFNGEDVDYVVKVLERDCSAVSSLKTLTKRCLLSISPNQTIMMHPLLQEMGRLIVKQESNDPAKRSRVWESDESHDLLRKGTGSGEVEGLALDNQKLKEEKHPLQGLELKTESFEGMCNLKLLYLKNVQLRGPYEHFSKDLIWLRWIGFQLNTIPSDLFMGNIVALDMSDSCLLVFEPPTDLLSLKILNFKDSHMLEKVLNINKIPNLETLILWNCEQLVYVCETIGGLQSLAVLNMTGCENLCKNYFPIPSSLERLFLTDCKLEDTHSFNLKFGDQPSLRYLNLGNNLFELLPINIHLGNLCVLDLTMCSKLKELLNLPSTLAELYINYCVLLEKVTFESHRFSLQKLEYEGCTSLSEIEGFIKLVPLAKLDDSDLGHLKWLKAYEDNEMPLVGADELTRDKSQRVQVLYEFGIVSTSLPDVKIPEMTPECILVRTSTSVLFMVPEYQENRRLKGLTVTFKYAIEDDDWAWFAKISTSKGVDLMYNPTISGRPASSGVGVWLSYWPIGNKLHVKDQIKLSIVAVRGLEVRECGASLVYDDVEVADGTSGWVETLDGDLSAFQLSKSAYYLCRRDFFDKVETGKPTPPWFRNLVEGGNIDHAEVQGWGKTGRMKQSNPSHGLEAEEGHTTVLVSRPSFVDKDMRFTSSIPAEAMNFETASELSDAQSEESEALIPLHHVRQPLQKLRAPRKAYDVFLSIGAEDTHNAFTDHLYDALARAGICPYRPADRGEELEPEVVTAIQKSTSSIVVFSEKYANSILCLDELLLIWEQKRDYNQFVLPIFYHVDPLDVMNQTNKFKIEVESSTRLTEDRVEKWKRALKEVSSLKGMVLLGFEAKFVQLVVDVVYYNCRSLYRTPNLTGISVQLKEIKFWLEKPDAEVLAIYGMKGSGKTTLAHYIFNLLLPNFELISFLEDIDGRCKMGGLCKLQESLLGDILEDNQIKVESDDDGMRRLEDVIQSKTTLIVLDNVANDVQLKSLLGARNINKHSKIIITSGDASIKTWIGSRSWRCREHKMKLLNDSNALELFSLHAFKSKIPKEGYIEFAKDVLRYCEGHPLALKVWGSIVSGHTPAHSENAWAFWESQVPSKLYDVLITSFNSLPNFEQELFLDIACFFTNEEMDYVAKILGHVDSGINTLINKHLVSVSSKGKLEMHRLHQEMGRKIVDRKSVDPIGRSRVWRDKESHQVLREGKGSKSIKGLALDMKILSRENGFQSSKLTTDALKRMENLELFQLKFVQLTGSYKSFSQRLRLVCWHGFHLSTIPSKLCMGNTVAIDMSYSKLEVFELPMELQSLQILNLKESHNLLEVRSISRLPNLESLILSCCHKLVHVCDTIGALTKLTHLNMTKCEMLFKGGRKRASLSLPCSLQWLLLKDCNLENANYFPPSYTHLEDLRVLDLTRCSNLKHLPSLPTKLVDLYINYCESLETVTFQSHRFTLREFGCEGCINLSEIEGIIKLEPVATLDGSYLGHMKWLKEYQNHEIYLVGNNELIAARKCRVQMLYEFGIMSTSLPDKKDPNMTQYTSDSSSLYFNIPPHLDNRRIKGLNVIFKYTVSSGDNPVWFAKISTNKGVSFMYNPTVFGKPASREAGIWFSYWPIGNKLAIGDEVTVSIILMSGLEVIELGASLVYTYDVRNETMEYNLGWEETLTGGGDLSRYKLSTGAYYLCRRDLFKSMDVHGDWFRELVGDTIDETELQGWKITGRSFRESSSLTEPEENAADVEAQNNESTM